MHHSICFRGVSMHMSMMRNMMMRKSPKKNVFFEIISAEPREQTRSAPSLATHKLKLNGYSDIDTERETENAVERRSSSSDSIPKLTPRTTIQGKVTVFLKFWCFFFPSDSKTAMQFGRVRIGTSFVVVITRFGKNFKLDI